MKKSELSIVSIRSAWKALAAQKIDPHTRGIIIAHMIDMDYNFGDTSRKEYESNHKDLKRWVDKEECEARPHKETSKTPDGWSKTDNESKEWRRGVLFRWASGFTPPCWINTTEGISIRPNETGSEAYRRVLGENMPEDIEIFWRDV